MKKQQIAFCLRRDYIQLPAGDIIQMERWKKIRQRILEKYTEEQTEQLFKALLESDNN